MARLFTVNFNFDDQKYTALVSLRQQGFDLSCMVRYVDKHMQHPLPGDVLVFSLTEGLKQPAVLPNSIAEDFVKSTTEAISRYLQQQQQHF